MSEQSGKERRRKPRFNVELPCALTLTADALDPLFPHERVECRTRDLSESGVGVVAHTIYIGYTCVIDEGSTLRLTLELPGGRVEMEVTPAHYLRLDDAAHETNYLIGLRITSMADADRALYASHLDALNKT
jgi:hypothetical protein